MLVSVKSETLASGDDSLYQVGSILEVIGNVESNSSITEYNCLTLSPNFDMEAYNQMCHLAHGKFSHLFR